MKDADLSTRPFAKRWSFIGAVLLLALWIWDNWRVRHSDAFIFAKARIEGSDIVQAKIGHVQKVWFPFPMHYHQEWGLGDNGFDMSLEAKGDRGTVDLDVALVGEDGHWKVSSAHMDGKPIVLK